jgi:hypothetical protein
MEWLESPNPWVLSDLSAPRTGRSKRERGVKCLVLVRTFIVRNSTFMETRQRCTPTVAPTLFRTIACFIPRNEVLVHLEGLVVVCLISVLILVPAFHVFAPCAFFCTRKRFAVFQHQKLLKRQKRWRHYMLV